MYDEAIKIDRKYVIAWYDKVLALNGLKLDGSLEYFANAVQLDLNYTDVWHARVSCFMV